MSTCRECRGKGMIYKAREFRFPVYDPDGRVCGYESEIEDWDEECSQCNGTGTVMQKEETHHVSGE